MKVAFQGERGAFSEIASKYYFGDSVKLFPSYSFNEVFKKVKTNEVNFGVVPIENTLYGSIFETYDLLLKYSLKIFGELNLQINHHLLAFNSYKINQIKKVFSHPQALGQCSEFLTKLKNAKINPAYDTAGAINFSIEKSTEPTAIIASRKAAELHNLFILKKNIQNNSENFTRFLIVGKKTFNNKIINPKTSICFELKSIPGALFKALSVFALRDIDLVKIESRPIPSRPFQYIFYVDLIGHKNDEKIKLALKHLHEISIKIKLFGTYETGKKYVS